ncbi:methanogenesis marker protein Mmp4/MtxX [Candidatus Methanomassiliicoccus intestinalis]|uniref:methanogenesis marker protein Mmp4/MtxX n=2 Tax=Candidatus Methanomassiliicoccus intestinalis TaxID=1406512 RepID=UPI0037DD6155
MLIAEFMLNVTDILNLAQNSEARIGIGGGDKAVASAAKAQALGYGHVEVYQDAEKLVADLFTGKIDAAVRGDMPANTAMSAVREIFGLSKVLRAVLMQPLSGKLFLLGPAGIDEGWTVAEKVQLAALGADFWRRLGIEPVVGIMSGGRSSDCGRMPEIDQSIDNAEEAVRLAALQGIKAEHVQILIEDAVSHCEVIIAPDGISGNLIFRTLHFLGHGTALGAPILNLDKIFIDTSRAKLDYSESIALATALAASQTRNRR